MKNKDQIRQFIKECIKEILENELSPSTKPDIAEPDTDTPKKPKRRTLTPPKVAPQTRPKASTNENEEELLNKITQKYRSLKK